LVVGLVVVVIIVVLVVVVEGGGGLMKEDLIVIDLICFDAFNCHSVLPDFDIDFFFFFSANVEAPLLGIVDIVDRRDVGDVVNICVILVLVGDDDEGIFVRLDIGRDV
jgi:hypothetical protein